MNGSCLPPALCPDPHNTTLCNPGGATCWGQCAAAQRAGTLAAGATAGGCFDASTEADPATRFPTWMAYADNPLGPYSDPVMVYNGSDQAGSTYVQAPATGDTNMAAVIFDDGSLAGVWRGDWKVQGHAGPVYQYQYRVAASDWRDFRRRAECAFRAVRRG